MGWGAYQSFGSYQPGPCSTQRLPHAPNHTDGTLAPGNTRDMRHDGRHVPIGEYSALDKPPGVRLRIMGYLSVDRRGGGGRMIDQHNHQCTGGSPRPTAAQSARDGVAAWQQRLVPTRFLTSCTLLAYTPSWT